MRNQNAFLPALRRVVALFSAIIPPADLFALVSTSIKFLEAFHRQLRDGFKQGEYSLEGDQFIVVIEDRSRRALDRDALTAEFGEERLAPCMRTTITTYVRTERKPDITEK
jgi:hypothetical protein